MYNGYETQNDLEMRKEHLKKADIRVLMLGASRVGKTSLLSLLSSRKVIESALKGTDLDIITEMNLTGTYNTMRDYFDMTKSDANGLPRTLYSELVLNDGQTDAIYDYEMLLTTKGKKGTYKIGFTDIPGEYLRKLHDGSLNPTSKSDLEELVSVADVIIITIDSVLMMENDGLNAKLGNNIDEVYSLISNCCPPQEGNVHKLFLFTPVKCEKYYLQHIEFMKNPECYETDPMQKLIGQIKTYYSHTLEYLRKDAGNNYFQAAILPVITLGDIKFKWFTEESYTKAVLDASDMLFEYVSRENPETHEFYDPTFRPEYCEQLLVYILLFQLAKVKEYNANKSFFAKFKDFFNNGIKRLASDSSLVTQASKLSKNLCTRTEYVFEAIQNPIGIAGVKVRK